MEKKIVLNDYSMDEIQALCGPSQSYIELLEEEFETSINVRGDTITLENENQILEDVIHYLLHLVKRQRLSQKDLMYVINAGKSHTLKDMDQLYQLKIARTLSGKLITPKTAGQKDYYYALKDNDIVFAIGPAGTGKTYLAVVFALTALKNGEVKRIILTRPAVEAGESLGFLPGDLKEKVDPYLRPLYDALYDMLGREHTERLLEKGTIEIAPLAYMRGRTLDDAYIILDEAQNTTNNQMKMFLTRLGFHSKMIITGDMTQIDLPNNTRSGLKIVEKILKNVRGIKFIYLDTKDIVRHPVVSKIVKKYDEYHY